MNFNREKTHKRGSGNGESVIYVMSRDQRVSSNHGLSYAQQLAIEKKVPLAVVFVLTKKGFRAREHYRFMLDGLRGVESQLAALNIPFMLLIGKPSEVLPNLVFHSKPSAVVFDFSPLKGPQKFIESMSHTLNIDIHEVDSHNIVPIWEASDKLEYGARTIRPKIHKKLSEYMDDMPMQVKRHPYAWPGTVLPMDSLSAHIDSFISSIHSNGQNISFSSGEIAAEKALQEFTTNRLKGYAELRNYPERNHTSDLSPYLHYGQISSQRVVNAIQAAMLGMQDIQHDVDALIEEMVVRKELSDNYCLFTPSYTSILGAPSWAVATLNKHRTDVREYEYTKEEFERSMTHDTAWNAAQNQLVKSGKMHGYMRMYWAKKVLEWTKTPEEALATLIYLNDFYSIDGGDPNGYTGIMWSVCGVHDRPWGERSVYGTIRSMVYGGLKRKFDVSLYEKQWVAR